MEPDETAVSASRDSGATATEYALLCGFIAMVIVFGVGVFGGALNGYYSQMASAMRSALGMP